MWQTDTVTIQTGTKGNNKGNKTIVWASDHTVVCDVQDINKEFVLKTYGITGATEYKQVFDQSLDPGWVVGNQVEYNGAQWWVKLVNGNQAKMGASNHVFIILAKVV